ncbi:hypothetical protein KGV52_00300 [Candidatus Gracilibacteria bacterium]|nr:hypothetical protein [Candidatus Gracilibacteria bacterium]
MDAKKQYYNAFVGGSAGALYPVIYDLYRTAKIENPQETQKLFPDVSYLLSEKVKKYHLLKRGLGGNTIEQGFFETGQKLIDIINQNRKNQDKLPDLDHLQFKHLSTPFLVITSRKIEKNNSDETKNSGKKKDFLETISSRDDYVFPTIQASVNPVIHGVSLMGKQKEGILFDTYLKDVQFRDAMHTNPLGTEWLSNLSKYGIKNPNITQITVGSDNGKSPYLKGIGEFGKKYKAIRYEQNGKILTDLSHTQMKHDIFSKKEYKTILKHTLMSKYFGQVKGFDRKTGKKYILIGENFENISKILEVVQIAEGDKYSEQEIQEILYTFIFLMDKYPIEKPKNSDELQKFIQLLEKYQIDKGIIQKTVSSVINRPKNQQQIKYNGYITNFLYNNDKLDETYEALIKEIDEVYETGDLDEIYAFSDFMYTLGQEIEKLKRNEKQHNQVYFNNFSKAISVYESLYKYYDSKTDYLKDLDKNFENLEKPKS